MKHKYDTTKYGPAPGRLLWHRKGISLCGAACRIVRFGCKNPKVEIFEFPGSNERLGLAVWQ